MPPKPKPKKVSYELIPRDSDIGLPMYALLDELVDAHHDDLQDANIALAWCTSWKPDADGHVTIGRCMKASDLHRELANYDFIILLSRAFWRDERVDAIQRRALLDHELCHAARKYDRNGEPQEDERGRLVYRTRRHDIEEFTCIVQRYGTYKSDLESFAKALRIAPLPFRGCDACRDTTHPGWVEDVADPERRLKRCACYREFALVRQEIATQ